MQETGIRNGAFGADRFGLKNLKRVHWNLGAPQLYQYSLAAGEAVLSADVVSISDGAGIAPRAARRPVAGRTNVARFIAGFTDWWADTSVTWLETNGQASVLVRRGATPLAVLSVATSESGIDQLMWVMAPDKLAHTTP